MNTKRSQWQKLIGLAIAVCLSILILRLASLAQTQGADLPPAEVHPLPASLIIQKNNQDAGDYFQKIDRTPLGYLVWSQFPVTVYVEQPSSQTDSAADRRFEEWVETIEKAIAEWNAYLPLQETSDRETADIIVLRSQPAREAKLNPDTGLFDIPRAVTAETTYKFYIQQSPATIAHKMTVEISPNYTGTALLATTRHELGHALGIWGHSPKETDALYFSQVSNPATISARDINTLIKIYQQPTKLGWNIEQ